MVGAALGGLSDAVIQLLTKPINEFSWSQVLQSTVAGAVSGAFGALTGIGGAAKGLSLANTVILGALDGWLSGMLSRGVRNLLAGNSFFDGYTLQMALVDLITGGLMSGIFYGVGKALSHVIDSIPPLSCRANSFSADTTVVTKDGDTPIHEIEIGDYVLAWNEDTGEIGWYKVTDTIHHTDEVVVHLTIDGEEIETTPEHPFYVEGKGWTDAEDLQPGDDIRQADGSTGEVESIAIEETSQEMYNLTVDEAHTFFVGDGQWLVHNCADASGVHLYSQDDYDALKQFVEEIKIQNAERIQASQTARLTFGGNWLSYAEVLHGRGTFNLYIYKNSGRIEAALLMSESEKIIQGKLGFHLMYLESLGKGQAQELLAAMVNLAQQQDRILFGQPANKILERFYRMLGGELYDPRKNYWIFKP